MGVEKIAEKMELGSLRREWKIQGTCGLTGEGLHDGLDWVAKGFKNMRK